MQQDSAESAGIHAPKKRIAILLRTTLVQIASDTGFHILESRKKESVMGRITELLDAAHSRSQTHAWSFAGALLPHEAHELLQRAPGARLIDVRSRAELELNGVIPAALHIEWQSWPGWVSQPPFSGSAGAGHRPGIPAAVHLPQRRAVAPGGRRLHRSRPQPLLQRAGRLRGRPQQGHRPPQRIERLETTRPALGANLIAGIAAGGNARINS